MQNFCVHLSNDKINFYHNKDLKKIKFVLLFNVFYVILVTQKTIYWKRKYCHLKYPRVWYRIYKFIYVVSYV